MMVAQILLTCGLFAAVDDEVFDRLSAFCQHAVKGGDASHGRRTKVQLAQKRIALASGKTRIWLLLIQANARLKEAVHPGRTYPDRLPAMAAGVSNRLSSMNGVAALTDAPVEAPKLHGFYRKKPRLPEQLA